MPTDALSGYQYADPHALLAAGAGRRTPVRFASHGAQLAGHVYAPPVGDGPFPAVVLLGPETYVKEQAPAEYARRLADAGFLALAFDPRGRGESEAGPGRPRDVESPLGKAADVRAALDYLEARPDVDAGRLFAVAVCQGSSAMVRAVADEAEHGGRVRALATLAGHYRDHEGDVQWFGGEDQLAARKARAAAARRKYDATGEVDYVPAVDQADPNVGMPGELVWGWYHRWADAGLWPNQFAVMSDAELLEFESMSASARLRVPTLMFHSDQCMLPDAARRHVDRVPAETRVEWWGDTLHFQFYDDPATIDRAVRVIAEWFQAHAPGDKAPLPTAAERDEAAVRALVEGVARDPDLRLWDRVAAAFAERVAFDYGTPETLTPAEILARWRPLLGGFDATQHEIRDLRVRVAGDHATSESRFRATHLLRGAPGGEVWTLEGRYEHEAERTPAGWKLTRVRMVPGSATGNTGLAAEVERRATAGPS